MTQQASSFNFPRTEATYCACCAQPLGTGLGFAVPYIGTVGPKCVHKFAALSLTLAQLDGLTVPADATEMVRAAVKDLRLNLVGLGYEARIVALDDGRWTLKIGARTRRDATKVCVTWEERRAEFERDLRLASAAQEVAPVDVLAAPERHTQPEQRHYAQDAQTVACHDCGALVPADETHDMTIGADDVEICGECAEGRRDEMAQDGPRQQEEQQQAQLAREIETGYPEAGYQTLAEGLRRLAAGRKARRAGPAHRPGRERCPVRSLCRPRTGPGTRVGAGDGPGRPRARAGAPRGSRAGTRVPGGPDGPAARHGLAGGGAVRPSTQLAIMLAGSIGLNTAVAVERVPTGAGERRARDRQAERAAAAPVPVETPQETRQQRRAREFAEKRAARRGVR